MEFPNLFSPIKINRMELKNRIVMTAMHLGYTPDGEVTDRLIDFYSLRAGGGVGLGGDGLAIRYGCRQVEVVVPDHRSGMTVAR